MLAPAAPAKGTEMLRWLASEIMRTGFCRVENGQRDEHTGYEECVNKCADSEYDNRSNP